MKKIRVLFSSFIFSLVAFSVPCGVSPAEAAEYSESCDAQAAELKDDCTALEAFYDSTGGANWTNRTKWKSTSPLGQWHGVTLNQNQNRVERLYLFYNNLNGTIPSELGNLTNLKELLLNDNQLNGTIPSEFGDLTNLEKLRLHSSQLSGTIPTELGNLTNLKELLLDNNQLSGTIPTELGNLTNLEKLSFFRNQLSGTIPSELGGLTNLKELSLFSNQLSGTIPTELGDLANLKELELYGNRLSGTIPDLSALTELLRINLRNNSLEGGISAEHLPTGLRYLDLGNNNLSGTLPNFTGANHNFSSLVNLRLYSNDFSGNLLAGHLPKTLTTLFLHNNNLSGTLPNFTDSNHNFGSLRYLVLSNNGLSGTIDASKLPSTLLLLYLDRNDFSGEIPSGIGSLTNLSRLYLHDNNLTGSGTVLSPDLGGLASLKELSLWGNTDPVGTITLHSSVKMSVVDRAALRILHNTNSGLDWSSRTGWLNPTLPLGQWHGITADAESGRVTALNLSGNGLKNPLTNSLEALGSLAVLNLSDNPNLSGTLPVRLKDIPGLLNLNIKCTGISTPPSAEFNTWLNGLGDGFVKGCFPPCPSGLTGVKASGSFVDYGPGNREFQIKVSWDEIPNATYTVSWENSPRLGFSGQVVRADKSYYQTEGDKIFYTIHGSNSPYAPARVTYTVSVTAVVSGCEDVSYGPMTVSTGGGVSTGGSPSAPPTPTSPGDDEYERPEFAPDVTAQDVVDRGTLRSFVKEAIASIKEEAAKAEQEDVPALIKYYGEEKGPWKHGAVYLFIIQASTAQVVLDGLYPRLEGEKLAGTDRKGNHVGEQIIEAAGEEGKGDFIAYYWKNPLLGDEDANPNSEWLQDGESPGTSYKVSYVEGFTLESYEPGEVFIMGSGIYHPEPTEPEPEPENDGGCAISGVANTAQGDAFDLLAVFAVFCVVALRSRVR